MRNNRRKKKNKLKICKKQRITREERKLRGSAKSRIKKTRLSNYTELEKCEFSGDECR